MSIISFIWKKFIFFDEILIRNLMFSYLMTKSFLINKELPSNILNGLSVLVLMIFLINNLFIQIKSIKKIMKLLNRLMVII